MLERRKNPRFALTMALIALPFAELTLARPGRASPVAYGGRKIAAVKVAWDGGAFQTQSSQFVDLPGATAKVSFTEGSSGFALVRFQGTSGCNNSNPNAFSLCTLRILVNGSPIYTGKVQDSFSPYQRTFAVERASIPTSASGGTLILDVQVQMRIDQTGTKFEVNNWQLTVEKVRS